MVRMVLALLAGAVLAFAVIVGIEAVSAQFFPIPANFANMDSVDQGEVMDELPFAAKALALLGWGLGSAVGAFAVRAIAGPGRLGGVIVALVIAGGLVTVFTIPHPLWMRLGAVLAPLAGGWIAARVPVPSLALPWGRRAAG
ncbi:MAG: hypothetical protein K2X73_10120 [Sphingomonas sp.]|uniref:hypothetical protein n=1 Tax=Sphingomonas sp. TaxID=28214 RepID=UPI0025FA744B|nr:hypothetical protein [Sphingomonas sp.]MBX9882317.1 hypothetical protein [Sphingomonas sp.]